jgi:DNA-binding IclR family transcriptional regulator
MPDTADQPIDRVINVLEAICKADGPKSIAEIASSVDLPAPTVHRVVEQLSTRGLLKRALGSRRVVIDGRLVHLGASILRNAILGDRPHTILMEVAKSIPEHCQIGIVSEGEVLYVDSARVAVGHGLQFTPGQRAPLHCTSIGKLFLASMSAKKFDDWLSVADLQAFTPHTIIDKRALRADIKMIRKNHWAYTGEEFVDGVSGCAVAIQTRGRFIGGLGVAAPSIRFGFDKAQTVLPRLINASHAIAAAIA